MLTERRPPPAVVRLAAETTEAESSKCRGRRLIAVTQRDDTLLLAPDQARCLAEALLRASEIGLGGC